MTAGYHDFEQDPKLTEMIYSNPFGVVTTQDQLRLALDEPLQFTPGTNWSYAHSNYVILGLALAKITKLPLSVALSRMVLRPLGLRNTVASITAAIPPPVLHAFSPERQIVPRHRALDTIRRGLLVLEPGVVTGARRDRDERHHRPHTHRDRDRHRPPARRAAPTAR